MSSGVAASLGFMIKSCCACKFDSVVAILLDNFVRRKKKASKRSLEDTLKIGKIEKC